MEWILILAILATCCISVMVGYDIANEDKMSILGIIVALLMVICIIVGIFGYKSDIREDSILKYQNDEYQIDTLVKSDTTYNISKCEK